MAARTFWWDRRGVSSLEMGMIGPVFVLLLLLLLDMGYQLTVDIAVQYGTGAAARYAITGSVTGTAGTNGSNATNNSTIGAMVVSASGGFLDPANLVVTSTSYTTPAAYAAGGTATPNSNGYSGSLVIYTVTYTAPYLTGLPRLVAALTNSSTLATGITHTANVAVQNEPY